MTTMIVDGREVKTNYREGRYLYPFCNGDTREGWTMEIAEFNETPREIVERLGKRYSRVSIYMVTTRVRGIYEYLAYCKR